MSAALCIAVGGIVAAHMAVDRFTLAWTHSVERIEWRERYRVTEAGLVLEEAHVAGSGAGMEPPDGARRDGAGWSYRPNLPVLERLTLANSGFGGHYRLCAEGACHLLDDLAEGPVELRPCPAAGS